MCLRCRPSRARTSCRCRAPASSPVAQGADRGPAGRDAGGDRVVDALAGHRVDEARRVAGEQQPAVGLLPPPAGERQVVALPVLSGVDRAGQQLLELVEQQRPGRWVALSVGRQQLAVAHVREAVAAVEGPGVRRLPAVAVADHLGAAPVRRGGRVAADRERPTAVRQSELSTDDGVRAVRADDDPGRDGPVEDDLMRDRPVRDDFDRDDPLSAEASRRGPRPARPAGRRRPRAG